MPLDAICPAAPAASGPAAPATYARATGSLRLKVERAASGRSVATGQFHSGALRVLRPSYPDDSGQAVFTVINPGGGYLGDDRYEMEYCGGPESSALVTTQSATKVYRTPQGPARQFQRFTLAPGSRIEYVPDQLIAYADAEYRQTTDVDLAVGAAFFTAEVVTPGWSETGEPFRYQEVRLLTRVRLDGRLLLWDNLILRPGNNDPTGLGWFDGQTHLLSLTAVHPGIGRDELEKVRAIVGTFPDLRAGCSLLDGPGLVLRALDNSSGRLTELAASIAAGLRARQTGQGPWDLRKY